MNKQNYIPLVREYKSNTNDYIVSRNKDNEQLRKEFSELQKQVRKLEEAHIKIMPDVDLTKLTDKTVNDAINYTQQLKNDQEVLGFKVEEANTLSGYKVKRVMSVNYETNTITIE